MDIRRAVGAKLGISREKLDELWRYRQSDRFSARERAALEYAEAITREDQEVTDACVEQLRKHLDRKSTRLNSSHGYISYAVFCLKKKKQKKNVATSLTRPDTIRT